MARPRRYLVGLFLIVVTPVTTVAQVGSASKNGIDHFILLFNPLDTAISEFAKLTGVTPVRGGQPSPGLENALVSLGDGQYLEILSPAPRPEGASRLPLSTSFRLAGWAIHTTDLRDLVNRLKSGNLTVTEPRLASRRRPDDALLSWSTANVTGGGLQMAPFFIQWDIGVAHPSETSPAGCRLKALVLTDPSPDQLAGLLRLVGVEVTIREGSTRNLTLTLNCPRGEITFTR